eukprot:CAMPEP_0119477400 /NCGR_PEP_ID=MMETSP1344-20130328/7551_1 /TAXON_ID=236787 /ORGANISM="Florenciella parvula, Strain CCMP2471" /LENGTH=132 /DNA_ID=CAMNT_0007511371 /DNA_START=230 /DNA_END=626 /DNA_ORIENTATION=-
MPERDHTRDRSARTARTIHQTEVGAPMKWMLTIRHYAVLPLLHPRQVVEALAPAPGLSATSVLAELRSADEGLSAVSFRRHGLHDPLRRLARLAPLLPAGHLGQGAVRARATQTDANAAAVTPAAIDEAVST